MLIRLYQIVKTDFLPTLPLNLNVFQIIIADQSFILLFLAVLSYVWQLGLPCFSIKTAYKHKYIYNDPLTWILIGQMSVKRIVELRIHDETCS